MLLAINQRNCEGEGFLKSVRIDTEEMMAKSNNYVHVELIFQG